MPRKLRMEYPGAIYHVVNRGDRREDIFKDDLDRKGFLRALEEACQKTETAMSLKWIARRPHMGSWTHVSNTLGARRKTDTLSGAN